MLFKSTDCGSSCEVWEWRKFDSYQRAYLIKSLNNSNLQKLFTLTGKFPYFFMSGSVYLNNFVFFFFYILLLSILVLNFKQSDCEQPTYFVTLCFGLPSQTFQISLFQMIAPLGVILSCRYPLYC